MPKALVPMHQAEEPVVPPVKYVPRKHLDDIQDREAMTRATQAYDALQQQLEQTREKLKQSQDEANHQRHRIDLLEQALSHAKNEAVEYRVQADEAKAQAAAWKVFFANVKSLFTQYELPGGAPKRIETKNDQEPARPSEHLAHRAAELL